MNPSLLSLLVFAVLAVSAAAQTGNEPRNVTQLYGKQLLEIVRSPDGVSAVLIRDHFGRLSERTRQV
jgi:hypothetical protein